MDLPADLLHRSDEEEEELELEADALDVLVVDAAVDPEAAGEAGAEAGAGAGVEPAFSEVAGVFVLSVPAAAGFSPDSFPEPGFILSE
jgi:hypothetical protein